MIDALTFDIGGAYPASFSLVSSDGLEPLPLPLPTEAAVGRFEAAMAMPLETADKETGTQDTSVALQRMAHQFYQEPDITCQDAPDAGHADEANDVAAFKPSNDSECKGMDVSGAKIAVAAEPKEVVAVETTIVESPDVKTMTDNCQDVKPFVTAVSDPEAQVTEVSAAKPSVSVTSSAETQVAEVQVAKPSATVTASAETQVAEVPAAKPSATVTASAETQVAEVPAAKPSATVTSSVETQVAEVPATKPSVSVPSPVGAPVAEMQSGESRTPVLPSAEKTPVAVSAIDKPVSDASVIEPRVVVRPAFEVPVREMPAVNRQGELEESEMVVLQAAPSAGAVLPAAEMPVVSETVQQVSATAARTATIVETVNQIAETIIGQIAVSPALVQGEGEIRITLKPTVLDGSSISLAVKGGELSVAVTPATPEAGKIAAAMLPNLETALAEHAPAFHHVAVILGNAKKGKIDEAA